MPIFHDGCFCVSFLHHVGMISNERKANDKLLNLHKKGLAVHK